MTTTAIEEQLHAFLRDQVLSGQDEGLSAATPLLELGILDSFGLFHMVSYLNATYAIDITADQINGRDFATITAITAMVERRLAEKSRAPAPAPVALPAGVAVLEAPGCAQVFIMFLGQGQPHVRGRPVPGGARELLVEAPEFFKRAGLGNRNIILFHDMTGQCYHAGVSADLPTRAAIFRRVTDWIAQRPSIEEVYCIGGSSGGPMAMLAGDVLKAKTVWLFAPRTAHRHHGLGTHSDVDAFAQQITGKTLRELETNMTEEDQEKIDRHVTPDVIASYSRRLLDPDQLLDYDNLAELTQTLSRGNGVTEYRLFYVAEDACDSLVVESLKTCPGVVPIALAPSDAPEPSWAFSRWLPPDRWIYRNHLVLDLLQKRDLFHTLFPAFRPARAMQPPDVTVLEAPGCAQLFIMSPGCFEWAGLGDRNVILIHGETRERHEALISPDSDARAALHDWLKDWIAQRPHIEETYVLGVSGGGPVAMLIGEAIGATTVWSFAPRPARRNIVKETNEALVQSIQRVTGKNASELQQGLTAEDEARISAYLTPDVVDDYCRGLLDPDRVLDAEFLAHLADTLAHGGATEHRIFYVPQDACDARVVESLTRCPGVTPIVLEPSDATPAVWPLSRWMPPPHWLCRDHQVVDLLRARGTLGSLFPVFRPAGMPAAMAVDTAR